MRAEIVKTVRMIKSIVEKSDKPDLIMIFYEGDRLKVRETYTKKNGSGKVIQGGHEKTLEIESLGDYLFLPDSKSQVILDLMEKDQGLYSFDTQELRDQVGIRKKDGFSIEILESDDESLDQGFNITVHERE